MLEFNLSSKRIPSLFVDDGFVELARANGFFERILSVPGEQIDPERARLGRALRPTLEANYYKRLFPGHNPLHMHLSAGKDAQGRDCVIVEFKDAKHLEEKSVCSRTPVPLEILAQYLPAMRLSRHVFEKRGAQTRNFLNTLGLIAPTTRVDNTRYTFSRSDVWSNKMPLEERFWRDMLESFALVFPNKDTPVAAAKPAAATEAVSNPARPAPPKSGAAIQPPAP